MPAYKDKAKGTWYASFYYEDWTGKKVKKMKRGFPTKREALEWERTFLQQQTADLEMTFENFVAVYVADMKGRIKELSLAPALDHLIPIPADTMIDGLRTDIGKDSFDP